MPYSSPAWRMTDRRYHDLVRLAYLVLPGRGNRVYRLAMARRIVDRSAPRRFGRRRSHVDAQVRARVLNRAMYPSRLLRIGIGPWLKALPPRLPDRALTQRTATMEPAARAAYVLRHVQAMPRYAVRDLLTAAGAADPAAALAEADAVPAPPAPVGKLQIGGPVRGRSRTPLAVAGALTAALVTALVVMQTGGSPQPVSADRIPVTRASADAWTRGPRTLDVWPARGDLARDAGFIGRALAAWDRKGEVPGRPQLLYAGRVAGAGTALLRDGRRVARYIEAPGAGARGAVQILTAGPNASSPLALGAGRYLVAPWTGQVTAVTPRRTVLPVRDGVTDPAPALPPGTATGGAAAATAATGAATGATARPAIGGGPGAARVAATRTRCQHGPVLELRQPDRLMTVVDLGGLAPAEVTHRTSPGVRLWDRLACALPRPAGTITAASVWEFWAGALPDGGGTGRWVCSRYTFLTGRTQAVSTFMDGRGGVYATGDCGRHGANAVSGGWWRSPQGRWHYLAAAGPGLSPRVTGEVRVKSSGGRSLVAGSRKGGRPPAIRVTLSAGSVR